MPATGRLPARALVAAALLACAIARPDIHFGTTKTSFGAFKGVAVAAPSKDHQIDSEVRKASSAENNVVLGPTPVPTALSMAPEADIVDPSAEEVKPHRVLLETNGPSSNTIVFKEELNTANFDNSNSVSVEGPESLPLFRDVTKAVNLRFPHAVLFGGTCGGSIISPKWVLTAGHCTLFTGGRYVLAGTNNSDDGSGVTRRVKKLYVHPLFSVGPYWLNADEYDIKQVAARWDFLLAELEQPLELDGSTIDAIPLNDQPDLTPDTYVGYAGYGTDHHGGYMRSEMHAMDLKIKSDQTCSKLVQFNKEDMLCAQGYEPNYNSACNGDSGSGLVANGKLVGIASWVENDAFECKAGNTVVFSKVAAVRQWIRQVAHV